MCGMEREWTGNEKASTNRTNSHVELHSKLLKTTAAVQSTAMSCTARKRHYVQHTSIAVQTVLSAIIIFTWTLGSLITLRGTVLNCKVFTFLRLR
uniref:ARAD1C09746p n=1 Tax=Blastobotrys adeninivorans TaxID=409370 RepID=A0A060T5Z7_BLAAD